MDRQPAVLEASHRLREAPRHRRTLSSGAGGSPGRPQRRHPSAPQRAAGGTVGDGTPGGRNPSARQRRLAARGDASGYGIARSPLGIRHARGRAARGPAGRGRRIRRDSMLWPHSSLASATTLARPFRAKCSRFRRKPRPQPGAGNARPAMRRRERNNRRNCRQRGPRNARPRMPWLRRAPRRGPRRGRTQEGSDARKRNRRRDGGHGSSGCRRWRRRLTRRVNERGGRPSKPNRRNKPSRKPSARSTKPHESSRAANQSILDRDPVNQTLASLTRH